MASLNSMIINEDVDCNAVKERIKKLHQNAESGVGRVPGSQTRALRDTVEKMQELVASGDCVGAAKLDTGFEGLNDKGQLDESLIEALETLIEMVEQDVLTSDEIEILDEAVDFISEDFNGEDEIEEELTEKRMSAKAKMAARRYRKKNRARLKIIAKKKKRCMTKIAGKTDKLTCNSKGRIKRKNKKRSRAAKRGARSR